jgi:predicted dehydrogenase
MADPGSPSSGGTAARLRIGTLSAARITAEALIEPAMLLPETVVTAVAARDRRDAEAYAAEHAIPVVHDSYEALLADPGIDAVYNPLPNSLHAEWTLRAIEAGKHVLCEKPFTSNAAEAEQVAAAARESGLVVMEAMHYRYHPLVSMIGDRLRQIGGRSGAGIRHLQCNVSFPLDGLSDIRYVYGLGGGAAMDAGCYALDLLRLLGPGEPEVVSALATEQVPDVDRAMSAYLRYPGGATAWLDLSFTQGGKFRADVHVAAEHGQLRVQNFIHPHKRYRLTVRHGGHNDVASSSADAPEGTTYLHQLRAFAAAVQRGEPFTSTPEHAVVTMRLIDDIYRAAGLPPRGTPQAG